MPWPKLPVEAVVPELGDDVERPPHLERAQELVILVLDVHLGPDQPVEGRVVVERGAHYVTRDPAPRLDHIQQRG